MVKIDKINWCNILCWVNGIIIVIVLFYSFFRGTGYEWNNIQDKVMQDVGLAGRDIYRGGRDIGDSVERDVHGIGDSVERDVHGIGHLTEREHFAQAAVLKECDNKPTFTFFFANWCGYCKKAQPEWEKFMEQYNGNVNILGVDCEKQKPLAKKHKVQGYPTIRYYPAGLSDISNYEPYKGKRDSSSFLNYCNSK